jgi:hypothetical protein
VAESVTQDQYVTQELAARKLKDTPANRKKLKNEWSTKYRGGPEDDWKTIFKNQFPAFASIVDGGSGEAEARATFGDDLIELFYDVARNPNNYDFNTQAGIKAWQNKVQATKFYVNVLPKQREWDLIPKNQQQASIAEETQRLQSVYADLELDDNQIAELALYTLRNKASELQTKYFAYSLTSKKPDGVLPTIGASDLKRNLALLDYKPVDIDQQIEAVLTGKKYNNVVLTEEVLNKKAKDGAKIMFPQYSKLIDEGYSLEDIFAPYRELAAKTLEMNPNSIQRDNPLFASALEFADEKGMGMSGTDWVYKMKSDPRYNYGSTEAANQQVNAVIQNLEKAFGKVR